MDLVAYDPQHTFKLVFQTNISYTQTFNHLWSMNLIINTLFNIPVYNVKSVGGIEI